MFAIFKRRDFRLMWSAQLVSTIGSALTDLAAGILVFEHTNSALSVGLILMVTALPTLFVGLFAGVFVDRFDRKKILLASDLLRGLIVVLIPLGVENFGLIAIYVLVFMAATVRQFFDPAWESILPEVAPEEELGSANAFLAISSFGSTAVGFAAAGFLATVDIHLPFYIDALTFAVSFALVLFVRVGKLAVPETTTVAVVFENLRDGMVALWQLRVLRSLLIIGLVSFFAVGLWNVLLLPMALRALQATEFEYGLQEAFTSIAFVIGSLLMARYFDRLDAAVWLVLGLVGGGLFGILYALSPNVGVAIFLVSITGLLNAPSSIARRTLLQRNIPREMRGRVFSAFSVTRDVVFLVGMASAGLADIIDVRILMAIAGAIMLAGGIAAQFMPGIGRPAAEWRNAVRLLRTAPSAPSLAIGRAATMMDLDRLIGVLPELGRLSIPRRSEFLGGALIRRAAPGDAVVRVGETSDGAYFVLDGRVVAGIPADAGEFRALSAMGAGDFFGEIAAITGSPRTANVVAEEQTDLLEVPSATLKSLMDLPEMNAVIRSKLTERLTRTANADLVRLAGLDQRDLRDLRRPRPRHGEHFAPRGGSDTHSNGEGSEAA
jgi:MFS family permease